MKLHEYRLKDLFSVVTGVLTRMLADKSAFFKNSARSTVLLCVKSRKITDSKLITSPVNNSADCFCRITVSPEAAVDIVAYLICTVLFGPFKADISDDFACALQLYGILVIIRDPLRYPLPAW